MRIILCLYNNLLSDCNIISGEELADSFSRITFFCISDLVKTCGDIY